MSKDDWEERAKDIVNLMLAYDIQVLEERDLPRAIKELNLVRLSGESVRGLGR
jgi:arginine repressor